MDETVIILPYVDFTDLYCHFQGETQDFSVGYAKANMAPAIL